MRRKPIIPAALITLFVFLLLSGCGASQDGYADLSSAHPGDIVRYGHYEQDLDLSNDSEVIEWIVLDVTEDRALLLSRYAVDGSPYNGGLGDTTWENCVLRAWLNDDFINGAFTEKEQSRILSVTVPADRNPEYDTDPGSDTLDRIFLLSTKEFERYCTSEESRICQLTEYSKFQKSRTGVKINGMNTWWWLRTPGENAYSASYVGPDGTVSSSGVFVNNGYDAVRPAMWVSLGK